MHIGIIPDGNRRWVKENNKTANDLLNRWKEMLLSRLTNKVVNFTNVEAEGVEHPEVWEHAKKITEVSAYVVSKDNLRRKDYSLDLIYKFISFIADLDVILDFRINIYGELNLLPTEVQDNINKIIAKTNSDSTYKLNLAVAYDPITDIKNFAIDENRSQSQIDMVVRSGREYRSSGFFPCNTLYSEWHYTDKLWPDMNRNDFIKAMEYYNSKQRRFGK